MLKDGRIPDCNAVLTRWKRFGGKADKQIMSLHVGAPSRLMGLRGWLESESCRPQRAVLSKTEVGAAAWER
jgi:hypothetical protein